MPGTEMLRSSESFHSNQRLACDWRRVGYLLGLIQVRMQYGGRLNHVPDKSRFGLFSGLFFSGCNRADKTACLNETFSLGQPDTPSDSCSPSPCRYLWSLRSVVFPKVNTATNHDLLYRIHAAHASNSTRAVIAIQSEKSIYLCAAGQASIDNGSGRKKI
jgi:hypothetical protein